MAETEIIIEPQKHYIVLTHIFDAPREVVFEAYTDPKLIPSWWGPRSLTKEVDRMEVKQGGIWRYINRDTDGNEYGFKGVYHDVPAPERLIFTFEFEGMPGDVGLVTITFDEIDGKTKLTELDVFPSVEVRDGVIQSGMETGARETMERLAQVVQSLL